MLPYIYSYNSSVLQMNICNWHYRLADADATADKYRSQRRCSMPINRELRWRRKTESLDLAAPKHTVSFAVRRDGCAATYQVQSLVAASIMMTGQLTAYDM